jgi:hypothetical protein
MERRSAGQARNGAGRQARLWSYRCLGEPCLHVETAKPLARCSCSACSFRKRSAAWHAEFEMRGRQGERERNDCSIRTWCFCGRWVDNRGDAHHRRHFADRAESQQSKWRRVCERVHNSEKRLSQNVSWLTSAVATSVFANAPRALLGLLQSAVNFRPGAVLGQPRRKRRHCSRSRRHCLGFASSWRFRPHCARIDRRGGRSRRAPGNSG